MRYPVARSGDVLPGKMVGVEVAGQRILLANIEGSYYAMRAKCNHLGGPLDKGVIEGYVVTCPLHGSKWDVRSGLLVQFTRPLPPERTYAVIVEGDQVSVEL
jgi:nitrite reductase/ring-hydroxylating ferredoxin subunit